jgi:hypothetical protein
LHIHHSKESSLAPTFAHRENLLLTKQMLHDYHNKKLTLQQILHMYHSKEHYFAATLAYLSKQENRPCCNFCFIKRGNLPAANLAYFYSKNYYFAATLTFSS